MNPAQSRYQHNIVKYFIVTLLNSFWFIMPIYLVYLQRRGISYLEMGLLESITGITILILEIPSGAIADLIGKKWAMFLGFFCWVIGWSFFGWGESLTIFILGSIMLGSAEAMYSGAGVSFLYDTLKKMNQTEQFLPLRGKLLIISSIFLICGVLIGNIMYCINASLPWFIQASCLLMASIITLTMDEPYPSSKRFTIKTQIQQMHDAFQHTKKNRVVRILIIISSVLLLPLTLFVNLMESPYLLTLGYDITQLGILFALSRGIIGLLGLKLDKIEHKLGQRGSLLAVAGISAMSYLVMALFSDKIVFCFILLLFIARDYRSVVIEKYINEIVPTETRASIFSIQGATFNSIYMVGALLVGSFLSIWTFQIILLLFSVWTIIFGWSSIIKYLSWKLQH